MPRAEQLVLPIAGLTQVAAAPLTLPVGTRGLLVGTGGNMDVTIAGVAHTGVPFIAGVTPGFFESVESLGTAVNVWAVT